jgi:hypothetical protein
MKLKLKHIIPAISLSTMLVSCGENHDSGHHTAAEEEHGHGHDEVSLGSFTAGDMKIEASQGHGKVEAGKEGHLVLKLPHKDKGATVVRAWIGTEDRTMSAVGKGDYDASHNVYNIHAIAPKPLPEGAKWWVEIEKPDGTKAIGSVAAKM